MAVSPTSERLVSINTEPITKKGIQKQNPQLGRIYTGRRGNDLHFVVVGEKTGGTALGAIFEKKHHDPTNLKPCKQWMGKVGNGRDLLPNDPASEYQRRRSRNEINLDAIFEKLASDFYMEMGRGIFQVQKTRLSVQPTIDKFTRTHCKARYLVQNEIHNTLRIMSQFVAGYKDFAKPKTLDAEGNLIGFMDFIEKYHRPPDEFFDVDDNGLPLHEEAVPLHGFMGLLAVGRVLADTDVVGGSGGNAGYIIENGVAQTVKIDPGYAFQFEQNELGYNWVINTQKKLGGITLDNIKDLQIANGDNSVTIKWESLTPGQRDEFLAALFNCGRYLNSKEVLHFLFYRDGHFSRSNTEQIPENVANDKVNEMTVWMNSQLGTQDKSTNPRLGIYEKSLTDFCNSHPEQVLKAHYVDNCGELLLPMSNETFPAGDLFTQLVIVAGDEQENKELETLKLPERDSLRETQKHMQQVNNPLPIESLFDPTGTGPSPKKVLLIGRAGVGKSTLCQKIAHDWASGKEWGKFRAIYWIPLRDVNNNDYLLRQETPDRFLAAVVAELLLKDPRATDGVLRQIQEQRQEILVIFDGYDEATEELCKTIDPLLADPELHILLTSRPGVTAHLHSNMDRLIENMGFSNKEVESYVGQFFNRLKETAESKQRAQKFLKAIKGDSNLSIISHIPLQLQMLCCLWERDAEKNGFANNIISLYHDMVDQLFCWQCEKQGRSPLDVRPEVKEKLFSLLGHIAYRGLASGKLLFPKEMVENILQEENISEKQLLDTGLLKVVGEGEGRYYYFLHLTFQEYLIAFAISRSTTNQRNRFILVNRYEAQYQLVMIFLAGLVHQRDGSFAKREVRGFFEKLHEGADEVLVEQRLELTLNCLKECPDYSGPVSLEFESLIKGDLSILNRKLSDKHTPFFFAIGEDNVPGMSWLYRMDSTLCSKPDWVGWTPLRWAAECDQIMPTEILLSWDSTLCSKPYYDGGPSPFHQAAKYGQIMLMKLLNSWDSTLRSKPDNAGLIPFHWAAMSGKIKAMKLLLSWDPTLCSKADNKGQTPLHWPGVDIEAMKLLLSWDSTLCSKPDNDGLTPLHRAAMSGKIKVMELLHSWDPKLYRTFDKGGQTLFCCAARQSQTEVMEWFLEKEPLFLKKMDKRSKGLLKEHASNGAKEWILGKEPTFFDEGCVIS